ncbi:D-alanine--poly(phosphoribitol) ligase, partial [Streptomyces sp. SID7982]|nr:D-alanine--poly(phosphoribitol) ligase [Streptomyces sp. SID7982]
MSHTSGARHETGETVEHPDPAADNLGRYLLAPAALTPDKAAVIEADATGALTEVTYRQLAALVDRYTRALEPLGLDVGDRVVVEAHPSAAAVAMLLACSRLGLPFVPVSPQTPDSRLLAICRSVEPALHARADTLGR